MYGLLDLGTVSYVYRWLSRKVKLKDYMWCVVVNAKASYSKDV